MTQAAISVGEHWPVLSVERRRSDFGSSCAVYQVDAKMLGNYTRALKALKVAEVELLESVKPDVDHQLMEPELLDYLAKLRETIDE